MTWSVAFHLEFSREFEAFPIPVQDAVLAHAILLERFGPTLGRPRVDTLKGSTYFNMKELRFDAHGGVWRVAFAFDPRRSAILLVGADKKGQNETRFYKSLIKTADARWTTHLSSLKERGR